MATDRSSNRKAVQALLDGFATGCNQVYSYLLGVHANDFRGMTFKVDESGYGLLIFKRVSDDGTPQVIFASGADIIDALRELEHQIATDKWKEDKPWKGGKKG